MGVQNSGASITLGLAQYATCTINNNDKPGLWTVHKVVINDNGGTRLASTFSFVTTFPNQTNDAGPFGLTTPEPGFTDGLHTRLDVTVPAFDHYTVREVDAQGNKIPEGGIIDGTYVVHYEGCDNVDINLGQEANCTITNDDITAHLTLVKTVTNNSGGTEAASAWTLSAGGPTPISGPGGANSP